MHGNEQHWRRLPTLCAARQALEATFDVHRTFWSLWMLGDFGAAELMARLPQEQMAEMHPCFASSS